MLVYVCYLIAYIIRKMDEKFTVMMDIGDSEIVQSIRLNERRGRKMADETTTVPNIFATAKIHL